MASELASLALVSAVVAAAMAYARLAASCVAPGFARLAALLPVLLLLPVLPFTFSSIHLRTISAFFLVWLCGFKLLLLAAGHGPLHPALPAVRFVACAALPIKLRDRGAEETSRPLPPEFLLSCAAKAAVFAALVSLRRFRARMPAYGVVAFDGAHVYLMLELFMACAAAFSRALLGAELEPQFDRPYLASSLRDFWGHRWNLMVPGALRPSVYRPVRGRLGAPVGVLATFLVSGLMHEVMFYYIMWRRPTGDVTAFFVLHGVCAGAEAWWGRHAGWWRPPRAVAVPLTLAFVGGTGFWLFFPAMIKGGLDVLVLQECQGMVVLMEQAGRWLAAGAGAGAGPVLSTR